MKKMTLLETPYSEANSLKKKLSVAVEYLTKKRPLIEVDPTFLDDIKVYSTTAASTFLTNIKSLNKTKAFAFHNYGNVTDIPSVLTINELTVDGGNIEDVSVPDFLKKCWVNITPIMSQKSSYNGRINVTDVTELSNLLMRGALTLSYHSVDTDLWLPPNLAVYVIEFYSSTIANVLGQAFNLQYDERIYVQTLFAAYYAQCLGGSNAPLDMPPLLLRCPFLGSSADINARLSDLNPHRTDEGNSFLYPYEICKLISKYGPPNMKKFDSNYLYRRISASAADSFTMLVAIDFPPYWVYQMLRVAHGYKNPTMTNMLRLTGTKTKLQQFAKDLCDSNVILKRI